MNTKRIGEPKKFKNLAWEKHRKAQKIAWNKLKEKTQKWSGSQKTQKWFGRSPEKAQEWSPEEPKKAQKWSGEPKRLETVGEKQAKKWFEKGSEGGLSPATVLEGGPGCTSKSLVGAQVARETVLGGGGAGCTSNGPWGGPGCTSKRSWV